METAVDERPEDDVSLKNCPFCGSQADVEEGTLADGSPWWYVRCTKCSAMADEIEEWNKRSNPSHADALAAIEQILGGSQPVDIPGALMVVRSSLRNSND